LARKRKALPSEPVEARIESLTHDGRGLAHLDGKAVLVHGALPGERVLFRYSKLRRRYDEGVVTQVISASPQRVEPRCPHFGLCGGCSLQHMDASAQIQTKQEILGDALRRIGKVEPEAWLPPLSAEHWGYRRKARLGVKYVEKKGKVLVGFRERGNNFLADLDRCEVIHPAVGERLGSLSELVNGLAIRDRVPQIEVAMGDGPCVLLFRVLEPPGGEDLQRLASFAAQHGFRIYLQEGGPESVRPLPGHGLDLSYSLPRHNIRLHFEPSDFTQVNLELNQVMVDRALDLLDPQPEERVLDLYCGLGNFTLPLARRAAEVVGVEGDPALVERARANAQRNGIPNASFHTTDLDGELDLCLWRRERFQKALLDPPRSGALQVLELMPVLGIRRLVYVSCYPSTLARDADRLVNGLGYRLVAAGAMDMFPHTAHVESIALFEKR
jgi:23S rRNA (uracil1939-C5)-methyltransferase